MAQFRELPGSTGRRLELEPFLAHDALGDAPEIDVRRM
jgi:hypothetical protein